MRNTLSAPNTSAILRHFSFIIVTIFLISGIAAAQDGGLALNFDGNGGWIEIADTPLLSGGPNKDRTVEAWAKLDNLTKDRPIVQKWKDSQDKEWGLIVDGSDSNQVSVAIETNGSNFEYKAGGGVVHADRWHHIAMSYDHTTQIVRIFIDGVEYGPGAVVPGGMGDTNAKILIGRHVSQLEKRFLGDIDEIRIWDVVKTAADLRAAMNKNLSGNEPGLIGYWKFDQDGSKVADQSGNGNTGQVVEGVTNHPTFETSTAPLFDNSFMYVIAPNGGESWQPAENRTIRWNSDGAGASVKIEYSADNGLNWNLLDSSTNNDGEFDWIVPDIQTSEALVRITDPATPSLSDVSEFEFSIGIIDSSGIPTAGPPCVPVDNGIRDFFFGTDPGVPGKITENKPESKLWFNDGIWWGVMWDPVSLKYRIHRFLNDNECWSNVGPDVDERPTSAQDALWDGQKLYLSSRTNQDHQPQFGPEAARLYRYSYDGATKSYSLDSPFPVEINNDNSETLVIAKDSSGQLWATWTKTRKVWMNRSLGDDATWGQPFVLPVQGNDPEGDDISTIIAFGGDKIGVMWSNQVDKTGYFAVHMDSKDDMTWESRETALSASQDGLIMDDHMNLATCADGKIFAAVKTNASVSTDPILLLLDRSTSGNWNLHPVSTVAEDNTRPVAVVDSEHDSVYVFYAHFRTPRRIEVKSAHLNNLQFPTGQGKFFISSTEDPDINDLSSTKQCVNSTSGLLAIASDQMSRNYFHNFFPLGGSGPPVGGNIPPVAQNDAASTLQGAPVAINILMNDSDSDGSIDPTTVEIVSQPGDGSLQVNSSGVVIYTPDAGFTGGDSFTYRVQDNEGAHSNVASVSIVVSPDGSTGQTLSFTSTEDGYIKLTAPSSNFGTGTTAKVLSGKFITYYKFNVSGIVGPVQTVTLKLSVTADPGDGSDDGGSIYAVSNNFNGTGTAWQEETLTAANAPTISGQPIDNLGVVTSLEIVQFDLTGAIAADGTYSFAISNNSTDQAKYYTHEGSVPPELIVETAATGGGNAPPVALDDQATTQQDSPVQVNILDNDSDSDGSLVVSSVLIGNNPANGSVNVDLATGIATYTPNTSFVGGDTFSYTVADNDGAESNEATVSIIVNSSGSNQPPVANDDAGTTSQNTPVTVPVLNNDSDSDGTLNPASVTVSLSPSNGTFSVNTTNGAITYSPNAGFVGVETFKYHVADDQGSVSNEATVTVTVSGGGGALVFSAVHDNQVKLTSPDKNYGAKTTAKVEAGKFVSYFKFDVSGLSGTVQQATLRLTVTTDVTDGSPDGGSIFLVSNDFGNSSSPWTEDLLTANNAPAITGPALASAGEVVFNTFVDLNVTAAVNGNGTYSFCIQNQSANQAKYFTREGASPPQLIVVTDAGGGGNIPPTAGDDLASTVTGSDVVIDILANDNDSDGSIDATTVLIQSAPNNGTVTVDGVSGSATYSPNAGFTGDDSFIYTVADNEGAASNQATVTVTVNPAGSNQPPLANNDNAATTQDTPVTIAVLSNDTDPDGTLDPTSVIVTSGPTNGATNVNATGTIDYTPANGFVGSDSFSYTVNDNEGTSSNVAAVSITVSAPGGGSTLTFQSVEDGQVKLTGPGKNYGTKSTMKVESGKFQSYLKFDVSGVSGSIVSARLRLRVSDGLTDGSDQGGTVFSVSNNLEGTATPWTEAVLTAGNAPGVQGTPLAGVGPVVPNEFVEWLVTPAIFGDGVYSFAITTTSANQVKYYTKEGANAPQLIIDVSGSGGGNTPPVAVNDDFATPKNTNLVMNVLDNDSDPDGSLDVTSVQVTTDPGNGSVSINSFSGIITYTPDNDFEGNDSFQYTVDDNDGATSNIATVSVTVGNSGGTTTLAFEPTDDGQVKLTDASLNYGSKSTAKVEQGKFNSYFKFSVNGITGTVQSARLRFFCSGTSDNGGSVHLVSNNFDGGSTPWVEESLTSGNAPLISGAGVAQMGPVVENTFVEVDVTSAVPADGTYSFALRGDSNDQAKYRTKDGLNPPQLLVEFLSGTTMANLQLELDEGRTGENPLSILPTQFELKPNFPNPFNPETQISYSLPVASQVQLSIYNLLGQEVRTLVNAREEAGVKTVSWNGTDNFNKIVASGVYFMRLKAADKNFIRKITFQK